ncbi:probable inactive DNA (cytosine-5)-methyltransferase DRM3 [Cucurbita moschata]|uniref:Probable inactive DNA (Cytosine-5)-methyltransferase DRM3 n=1 Tax=Cucurbita moschata TaxID=3662 RepID=A0A6J1ER27_CUCMO|nr:probable inactive DNA (cytosine-5)-methyltransferase DRM3 [Cucurbita moschata]XP_022930278.1 probable inactive DNA (cytosine-5)-methyltransferase DRM3 [Cucurbita moschata]XP_022930279.1 probable inactive DNA (cytosine-5)-methyltransferase DRM3 [Cucurbita moschata]
MASNKPIVPKEEVLDFRLPPDGLYSRHVGDSGASSSGNNIRTFFVDMGFLPSLVDKVIEEKGEDDVELLLNTLTTFSAEQKSLPESTGSLHSVRSDKKGTNSIAAFCYKQAGRTSKPESSDSLDSLFDDKEDASNEISSVVIPKEEADDDYISTHTNKASLLMMNFSVDEVNFAIDKLGGDAPINELVDFIVAAQIAENLEKETDETICRNELKTEENDETLFVTMEKTLRLLEMGFSENEVSLAIEKFGSDTQVSELADSIVTGRIAGNYPGNDKCSSNSFYIGGLHNPKVKAEDSSSAGVSLTRNVNVEEILKGKRPKEEYMDDLPNPIPRFDAKHKGKRPKPEYADDDLSSLYSPEWLEAKVNPKNVGLEMPTSSELNLSRSLDKMVARPPSPPSKFNPCRSLDKVVAKPPFFLYGNVLDVSRDSWGKVSKFLYTIEPEFVDTRSFSALSRREGYVHNLPCENRSHILPKPAMTIEDAIPHTKKWWPSWDTRKHLSCINSETRGVPQLCERLTKTMTDSHGQLSSQQQRDILHHCIALNLIWVGQFKLAPLEPEQLEYVLGYPVNHTQDAESSSMERLQILKYCFQIDTLGYHLSVLKSMFPEGLIVLSIFSGIGGAEIALLRLGIHLKVVISVESSAAKRRILQKWWRSSGQTGELELIEDIQKLTSNKIHNLIKKYGGFDLVVCQNPCSRSLSSSKLSKDTEGIASFDFSIFYEFVRVLQGVRNTMERKK